MPCTHVLVTMLSTHALVTMLSTCALVGMRSTMLSTCELVTMLGTCVLDAMLGACMHVHCAKYMCTCDSYLSHGRPCPGQPLRRCRGPSPWIPPLSAQTAPRPWPPCWQSLPLQRRNRRWSWRHCYVLNYSSCHCCPSRWPTMLAWSLSTAQMCQTGEGGQRGGEGYKQSQKAQG